MSERAAGMPWDAAQYLAFEKERAAPFQDCLALVARRPGMRVIDLGCGTGELTRRLALALDGADVLGVDSSAEMLAHAPAAPRLRFEQRRIEEVAARSGAVEEPWDLVFSHAAIQWVDDHRALVPRLLGLCAPGGQLVVQQPSNHDHPSQAILREVASEHTDFRHTAKVLPVAEYAELLHAHGGRDLTVFEKVYPHVLQSADAVVEWIRGTALLPYLQATAPDRQAAFLERYRARVRERWPSGPVFFGFRRIICAARRA